LVRAGADGAAAAAS